MEALVRADKVIKQFGNFTAVDGVSFEIRRGECFGLLGPNGAGKSTFIGMIYGVVRRSGGALSVFGMDPAASSREIKRRLGVVTQDNALDESLTVRENMTIYAAFIGVPFDQRAKRVEELLEYMQLTHKADAMIRFLSGGMKRRLVFVRALLGEPELVILDEPTTGLDPAVRHLLWGKVNELKAKGTTVVLTTHYMHEAEVLCDRLVVMNQGKVIEEGSPQEMIARQTPGYVGVYHRAAELEDRIRGAAERRNELLFSSDSSGYYLRARQIETLISVQEELRLQPLQLRPANLEDVFLKITGRDLTTDA